MTILLVEQYYDFARALADRYAVMSRGEIIRSGDADELDQAEVRAMVAI